MNNRNRFLALLAAAAAAGCASPKDNVIFVTKTSLGIDVDGTPPSASIAYDRTEGYLGPRLENGTVPPVVAKISTNGLIFGRKVTQYYATGTAANILTGSDEVTTGEGLEGEALPMFFGTSTTLGIKIGFTTTLPDSFVFGYKRKEASLIPLGIRKETAKDGSTVLKRAYPPVIGVFSNDYDASTLGATTFGLSQFFATGTAAVALAKNQDLKDEFRKFARDALGTLKENIRLQQETVLNILTCFADVRDDKIEVVAEAANHLELFAFPSDYDEMTAALKAKTPPKARYTYSRSLSRLKADAPNRQGKLEGHFAHVCSLRG